LSIKLTQPYPNDFLYWPRLHVRSTGSALHGLGMDPSHDDVNMSTTNNKPVRSIHSSATVFLTYNNILYANFIDFNELVVIEQPWRFVLPTLPDSLERKVYGT
jgi:hypothetical protein